MYRCYLFFSSTKGASRICNESILFRNIDAQCIKRQGSKTIIYINFQFFPETMSKAVEEKGFRVSRKKTEFMIFNFIDRNRKNVKLMLWNQEIKYVEHFMYLKTATLSSAGVDQDP